MYRSQRLFYRLLRLERAVFGSLTRTKQLTFRVERGCQEKMKLKLYKKQFFKQQT